MKMFFCSWIMCWLSHLPDLEGMQSTDEICCFGLHKGFGYVRAVLGLLQFLLNFDFFLLCLPRAPIQQRVSVKHLSYLCMVNLEAVERTYICMCSLICSLLLLWCWGQLCCWQQQGLAAVLHLRGLHYCVMEGCCYCHFSSVLGILHCESCV